MGAADLFAPRFRGAGALPFLLALLACGTGASAPVRTAPGLEESSPARAGCREASLARPAGGAGLRPPSLSRQPLPKLPACAGGRYVALRPFVFDVVIDAAGGTCVEARLDGPVLDPPCPELASAYEEALAARRWTPALENGTPVPVRMRVEINVYDPGR